MTAGLSPRMIFWIGAGLAFLAFLVLVKEVLLPFVLGAGIAYLLDPIAERLQRAGASRFLATLVIGVLFMVLVLVTLIGLMPLVVDQLGKLALRMPDYIQALRDIMNSFLEENFEGLISETDTGFDQAFQEMLLKAQGSMGLFLKSAWTGGLAVVNVLALIVVTPVVAFYLLLDWNRMISAIDSWLPRDYADTIRDLARQVDAVISGFVRGQVAVLILLSVIYVVGLSVVGLNFALLVGLTAGLISFVPYLGPIVGFVVGGIVAVGQFWPEWMPIAGVLGVFVLGQFVEGNVLSPMIVGDRTGLHPVWLIFSLFAFAYLFGFVGMLIAVPVAAAIGVLVRFLLNQYLDSSFYRGREAKATRRRSN